MRWAARFAVWLFVRPWLAWVFLLVALGPTLVYTRQPGSLEAAFRYHGLALQLVGVALVAKGLHDTTNRFKRPGPLTWLHAWVATVPLPWKKSQHFVGAGSAALGTFGVDGVGMVWMPTDDTKSVEQRLKALEFNVDALSTQIDGVEKRHHESVLKLTQRIKDEEEARKAADRETAAKLEAQVADGIVEGYFGLAILFLGTIYSGLPKELSDCFVQLLPGPPLHGD